MATAGIAGVVGATAVPVLAAGLAQAAEEDELVATGAVAAGVGCGIRDGGTELAEVVGTAVVDAGGA